MDKTIFGIFADREHAESAINELESKGFNTKDISIIMRDQDQAQEIHHNTGANVAGGAASGATTGAVVGGIAGLLIGIGAITIPGIGGLLVGGQIAAALGLTGAAASTTTGALTGALAGGLLGALVSLGVPESDARVYEARVREGGILVAVAASGDMINEATTILEHHNASQVRSIGMNTTAHAGETMHGHHAM
jgi:hypothetical protein